MEEKYELEEGKPNIWTWKNSKVWKRKTMREEERKRRKRYDKRE